MQFGNDVGENCYGLIEWPKNHIVKLLCYFNPKDTGSIKIKQERRLISLYRSCRHNNLDMIKYFINICYFIQFYTGSSDINAIQFISYIIGIFSIIILYKNIIK